MDTDQLVRIHSFASSLRSCQNLAILNSTQPPPKAYNLSYLKGTHNAPIGTIFSKNSSSPASYPHPHCGLVVQPKPTKEKLNILLFTFLLMNSLRKHAASPGSIEIITLYVFLRRTVSTHKNFSLHLFLKNGQVQYFFENKAYLKPCIYMKNR